MENKDKDPVFVINTGTPKKEKSSQFYTFVGEHDFIDEEGYPRLTIDVEEEQKADYNFDIFQVYEIYAMSVKSNNRVNYYVKRGKHGRLFNPIGMYSEGTVKKQMRHAGKPEWRLQQANEQVFNLYINFLKTKNIAYLNQAEREV